MTAGSPKALAQRLLSTRIGGPLGVVAYELVARAAASALGRIEGVRSVYVTGSFARLEPAFRPGYSDLDLIVLIEPESLDAELRTRDALARLVRTLRATTRIVQTLDVIEARDLRHLERHGSAWSVGIDTRWRLLHGARAAFESPARPVRGRRTVALLAGLRRWQKAGSVLLAHAPTDVTESVARAAERLAMDCAGAVSDVPHGAAYGAVSDAVRDVPELAENPAFAPTPQGTSLAVRRDRALLASLVLLDWAARETTRSWSPAARRTCGEYVAPRGRGVDAVRDAALEAGFATVAACARDAGANDSVVLVVAPPSMSCEAVLAAGSRVLRDTPPLRADGVRWAERPALLTSSMLRAALLLDPPPFAFDSLMHEGALLGGERPILYEPSDDAGDVAVRCTRAMHFSRARSRRFHAASEPEGLRRTTIEVRHFVAALNAREARGAIEFHRRELRVPDDERALIRELRAELEVTRRLLDPEA